MKTGAKIFWIVLGCVVVLGVVLFFVLRGKKTGATVTEEGKLANAENKGSVGTGGGGAAVSSQGAVYASLPVGDFPLKKGSKGKLVYLMQYYLNTLAGANLTLDGNWGTLTDNYVKSVLKVDTITKELAVKMIQNVPADKGILFKEYVPLISQKITATVPNLSLA